MAKYSEHFFMHLLAIVPSSFEKCLFNSIYWLDYLPFSEFFFSHLIYVFIQKIFGKPMSRLTEVIKV
jgi:hypothetical protein